MRPLILVVVMLAPEMALSSDLSVSQTDCLPADQDGTDEITVALESCAVRIIHTNVVINCCLDYDPVVAVDSTTIEVYDVDTGPPCDCLCPFDLEVAVGGLEPGVYDLVFHAFLNQEPLTQQVTVGDHCQGTWIFAPMVWTHPGIQGLTVPVYATHDEPLRGFSFGTTFPVDVARMADIHLHGTDTEIAGAELLEVRLENGNGEPADETGWATCSVILDQDPPFANQVIPPGNGNHLANLVYDILPPAESIPRSIGVPFPDTVGDPEVRRRFAVDVGDATPSAEAGIIQLVMPVPDFIRGDANDDRTVDISDARAILEFVFLGRREPPCADANDANDDGRIDISDAITVLLYLFRHAPIPPPEASGPPGPDPTLDSLGCVRGAWSS